MDRHKQDMVGGLTGAERVLFSAEYQFNINTLGLSKEEAHEKATAKITSVRALTTRTPRW
jgi:hypothetical protein